MSVDGAVTHLTQVSVCSIEQGAVSASANIITIEKNTPTSYGVFANFRF